MRDGLQRLRPLYATVATSAEVLKWITDKNVFWSAAPLSYIRFRSSGKCNQVVPATEDGSHRKGLGEFLPPVLIKAHLLFVALLFAKARHQEQDMWNGKSAARICCARMAQTQGLRCSFNARLGRPSWWMDCRQQNKSRRFITGRELSSPIPTTRPWTSYPMPSNHNLTSRSPAFCDIASLHRLKWTLRTNCFCITAWSKRIKQKKEKLHLCTVWARHLSHSGRTLTWLDSCPEIDTECFQLQSKKTGKMRGCLQIPLNSPAFPRELGLDNKALLIIH